MMWPSSESQPSSILASAVRAALPAAHNPPYEASAVRAALVDPPAVDEADTRHDRGADDDGRRDGGSIHGGMLARPERRPDGRGTRRKRSTSRSGTRTLPRPGRARNYIFLPRASRPSLAAFSDSACLPSLWSLSASAAFARAVAALASNRLPTWPLISAISFGHWNANAELATSATAVATRAITNRCMTSPPPLE